MRPALVILGQVTVDHVVPAEPGRWRPRIGGNALYAAAGARLWSEPAGIGVVARCARGLPGDVGALLESAGFSRDGLVPVDVEPLTEWLLYEPDGERRSLPRNPALREPGVDTATLHRRYLGQLAALSATAAEIPASWLPAAAAHLAPQVGLRHRAAVRRLRRATRFLSVDPSPHYTRRHDERGLARLLAGAHALLPSRAEVAHLAPDGDWPGLARRLGGVGFREVVVRRGARGCLVHVARTGRVTRLPAVPAAPRDLTGAGDAFAGAYAACRALDVEPVEAARRAAVAAAMVVECAGAAAALRLSPGEARARRAAWGRGAARRGGG